MDEELSFKNLFFPLTNKKAFLYISIIGIIVYFNALFGNFVWDDIGFILLSPELHSFNLSALVGPNVYNSGGYYRMIPSIYIAAIYTIFGPQPFYFHLFQIILHIINACLVFLFLQRFFKKTTTFFLSILFLIHPIQVESVSFISSVQSNLFFFFGTVALLIAKKDLTKVKNICLISPFLLLSMLTKETGFLFIIITVLYQLLFKNKKERIYMFSYLGVILTYFFIRFGVGKTGFEKNIFHPLGRLPLFERLLHIPELIFYYIKMIFFPLNMAIDQLWTIKQINFLNFYLPLLIDLSCLLIIILFGFFLFKQKNKTQGSVPNPFKTFLFFSLWLFFGMAMLMQIFPLDMTVADRWFYFPIIGLLGIVGIALEKLLLTSRKYHFVITVLLTVIIILFSIRTIVRNANYADAFTLYTHDIATEDNYDLENMLGGAYLAVNKFDLALPYLMKSYELYPRDSTLFNIASANEQLKNYQEAKESYEKLIHGTEIEVRDHVKQSAYKSYTKLLLTADTPQKTKQISEEALRLYPNEGGIWAYLAVSNYTLGLQEEAVNAAKKANEILNNESSSLLYNRISQKLPLDLK